MKIFLFINTGDLFNESKSKRRPEDEDWDIELAAMSKKARAEGDYSVAKSKRRSGSPLPANKSDEPAAETPLRTELVLPGQNFNNGDFVIIKGDDSKESFPIWR